MFLLCELIAHQQASLKEIAVSQVLNEDLNEFAAILMSSNSSQPQRFRIWKILNFPQRPQTRASKHPRGMWTTRNRLASARELTASLSCPLRSERASGNLWRHDHHQPLYLPIALRQRPHNGHERWVARPFNTTLSSAITRFLGVRGGMAKTSTLYIRLNTVNYFNWFLNSLIGRVSKLSPWCHCVESHRTSFQRVIPGCIYSNPKILPRSLGYVWALHCVLTPEVIS